MGLVRGDTGGHDGHRIDCELPAIDIGWIVLALRRSHNLSMLKSSNMLAQALAALTANDVPASQQSRCSFDGTAFLIRAPGSPVQVCKDRGRGTFHSNRFNPGGSTRRARMLCGPFSNHHAPDRRPAV
jgi:hypothetical protein